MQSKTVLHVGGARNVHGTRIAKRIQCAQCGCEDYITARPSRTRGVAYCRKCALQVMNAIESGKKAPRQMKEHICTQCQQAFSLPVYTEIRKAALCPNCLKGFEVWRGSKEMSPEIRENLQCELRKPGVLLRKSV